MGTVRPPAKAKLFAGLLSGDADLFMLAVRRLEKMFGETDLRTRTWPFNATDYYEPEMGGNIQRQFVFFRELISVERLADIKRQTNDLELALCDELLLPHATRPVNIDPGYMTLSKLVLATTKDHAHRIYLQRGIYAEVTLRYQQGRWQPWPWTYPDYAADNYHAAFKTARDTLHDQLTA